LSCGIGIFAGRCFSGDKENTEEDGAGGKAQDEDCAATAKGIDSRPEGGGGAGPILSLVSGKRTTMPENADLKPAVAPPPQNFPSLMQGRCCCGNNGEHYMISTMGLGQKLWLKIVGDKVVSAPSSGEASGFAVTPLESGDERGKVKLSEGSRNVAVINGAVQMSEREYAALAMNHNESGGSGYTLQTADGMWLSVSRAGEPVSLTRTPGSNVIFGLERAPQTVAHYAADEGYPFNEEHNTHLWIFNRACDLLRQRTKFGGVGQGPTLWSREERDTVLWCLSLNSVSIKQGIYDADNLGGNFPGRFAQAWVPACNPHTTGFIYSAHFWDPISGKGGWWDGDNDRNNGYEFGTRFWQWAVEESDPVMSGYYLGLAIHYLEDLAQPMHCGDFPNLPGDSRHAYFEAWALKVQSKHAAKSDFVEPGLPLVRPDVPPSDPGEYWRAVGKFGLVMYNSWKNSPGSPLDERWIKVIPDQNNVSARWSENLGTLLAYAQALIANVLVSYALFSKIGKGRGTVSPTDVVLKSIQHDDVAMTPEGYGAGADNNRAYSMWIGATSAGSTWALEPVVQNGTAVFEDGNPVYYIRNRSSKKCIVAPQDWDDGGVYYQDPGGRDCAQWVLETTGTDYLRQPREGRRYPTFTLRDRKWKKYLIGSDWDGKSGPLKHGDLPPRGTLGRWIQIPAQLY
jgi:hypothetical protein